MLMGLVEAVEGGEEGGDGVAEGAGDEPGGVAARTRLPTHDPAHRLRTDACFRGEFFLRDTAGEDRDGEGCGVAHDMIMCDTCSRTS